MQPSHDEDQAPAPSLVISRAQSIFSTLATKQVEAYALRLSNATSDLAGTIRDIGNDVGERRNSPATKSLAESIASTMDRAGAYLESTDGATLFSDLQQYGRDKPLLASAVAALAGLAAARILKVSSIGASRPAA